MRSFVFAAAALSVSLTACQLQPQPSPSTTTRIQGALLSQDGLYSVLPCNSTEPIQINLPSPHTQQILERYIGQSGMPQFVDFQGARHNGSIQVHNWYRIQDEGFGCNDSDFSSLEFRVLGNEPFWSLLVTPEHLAFTPLDGARLQLEYAIEQHADGSFYLQSKGSPNEFQAWLRPQYCTDSMSGALSHLTATVELNGTTLQGCAYFGANRH